MTALVAGGTGFIGRHLVRDLVRRGARVRVLARRDRPVEPFEETVEIVRGDILDVLSLEACARGVDIAFSAFGLLGQWGVPESEYRRVNLLGVKNLLAGCLAAGVPRFVHLSSAGVLGPLPPGRVGDETYPFNPSNAYEKTKSEAEEAVISACGKAGFPYTILRPEFVYGPGDMHVLGLFRAIRDRKFVVLGSGKSLLHPTYIDDLIQAIGLCLSRPAAIGQTYLIAGEKPVTVRDLAATIAAGIGVAPPKLRVPALAARAAAGVFEIAGRIGGFEPVLTRSRVAFFTQNRAFSLEKARAQLGYEPRVGLRDGVARTVLWYREKGCL